MRDLEVKRHWIDICAEFAICDNSKRLAELANEITQIIEKQQQELKENETHTAA